MNQVIGFLSKNAKGFAVKLSLLIPAYNEAGRLPPYLYAIKEHFSRIGFTYEVIVVDDGSTDGMATSLERLYGGWPQFRIVRHGRNQGRGQAIRTGNAAALGDFVLYADADGATPIHEETKLQAAIEEGADVAIGSRVIRHEDVSRARAIHRAIISKVYGMVVNLLVKVPARDTMCGFKMWRRHVGQAILDLCADTHWLLDVEFLAIAHRLGYRVAEVPVNWSEITGSKVRLVRDSLRILPGLWKIRRSIKRMARKSH
jgi:dolichyl-phosphate beta-glucosyltransferase